MGCRADAGELDEEVTEALVMLLEVAAEVRGISYDEVRARRQAEVRRAPGTRKRSGHGCHSPPPQPRRPPCRKISPKPDMFNVRPFIVLAEWKKLPGL